MMIKGQRYFLASFTRVEVTYRKALAYCVAVLIATVKKYSTGLKNCLTDVFSLHGSSYKVFYTSNLSHRCLWMVQQRPI
jgi:hypothetical protein